MKKTLFSFLVLAAALNTQAQCTLTTISTEQTITCGDCVTLSAFGNGSGNIAFQENFNSGSPAGWQFTQSVTISNNTCGEPSPDNSNFMWMGDDAVNPRDMTTVGFNLSLGGTICFDMRYSVQGDASPCEGPDEPDEGVYLQYSTNGGTTWNTIQYYDPNGGYDDELTEWNQYCAVLPPGAMTANTMIRWHQDDVTDAEFDHWGIDNVGITLNDPSFQISWQHDGFTYPMGSGGGNNPTPVCPQNTTTYTAQISNGTTTCTSAITVTVVDPVIIINAGNDTTLCNGDCATIHAEAYELVSPASTPTFDNSEITPVTGGNAEMNINVQGLNATTVTTGSITSICLNSFNFSGTQICTNFFGGCNCNGTNISFGATCNLDVSSFNITVTSPGGCELTLVPAGTAIGTSYTNVCFVPAGGQSISLPSFPTPGNWDPAENFSALNGCQSNGVWTMQLNAPGGFGFGLGFLNGWSISFDDPEITAPVNYSWSPTTNMTGSTTLTPTVCPTTTTTYTLTATDTDGCTTVTDDVTITTGSCCALTIDNLAPVNPSCGASDGTITATVSGQITGLEFSIDNGATFQTSNVFSGLPAGSYTIQANDDNNCLESQTIVLTNAAAPVISSAVAVNASCGASDGQITVTATGTGTLTYSSDNGTTFQASSVLSGLAAGTYTIVVEDAGGCQATTTATVANTNGPAITTVTPTNPACGASDGSLQINASGGTGTLQYSIDNGVTFQPGNSFTALAAGTYTIVVQDASGCEANSTGTLVNANAPVINSVTPVNPGCGAADGSIQITASGGSGTLQYSTDNGTTFQAGNSFTALAAGTYTIVVQDAAGCEATTTQILTAGTAPTIDNVASTDATCGNTDGSITITASGGSGTIQYSIDNGTTFQGGGTFPNLASGSYTIVIQDAGGCQDNATATISDLNGPVVNAGTDQVICAGEPVALSGTGPAGTGLTWDNGVVNNTAFIPTATTTYTLTGIDANGCTGTDQVTVTVNTGLTVTATADISSGCAPLTVTFSNTTLNPVNCNWQFSNGLSFTGCGDQTVTFTSPGCYSLTLTSESATGCTGTGTFTNIVCVTDNPVASFNANPSVLTLNDPLSIMNNTSSGGATYNWNFGDGSPNSSSHSPAHIFPGDQPGAYEVTLTVMSADGCPATATGTVVIEEELVYFVPNTFTPDGDEFNQVFTPVFTSGFDPYDFNMTIFNRWGEIIFETEDHKMGWDGSYHDILVPEGVYTWKIEFKIQKNDERKIIHGHVQMLK